MSVITIFQSKKNTSCQVLGLLLFLLSLPVSVLKAQTTLGNTPFSRQPMGENVPQGLSRNQAMGGASVANLSGDFLNLSNPADLIYNRNTNFETSVFGLQRTVNASNGNSESGSLIINHIVFGFPVGKKTSMALGLMPVSFVDYSLTFSEPVKNSITDTARYNLTGTGGISKAFLSISRRINTKLSVGLEGAFQFGTIDYKRQFGVLGRRDEPISTINTENRYKQLVIKPGLTYRTKLDTGGKRYLTLGLTYQIGNNASFSQQVLSQQLTYYYNDPFYSDTLQSSNESKIRMPSTLSFGMSIAKSLSYTVAGQLTYTNWNSYKNNNGDGAGVNKTLNAALGAEWIPDAYSTKYYNIIAFRTGINYQTQAIVLNGNQVNQTTVSLGLGLPLTRKEAKFSRPFVNLNFFAGIRGSNSSNNLQESFYAGSISLVLNDFQWFQRYKLQ